MSSPEAAESPASDGEKSGTPMLQVLTDAKGRIVAMAAVQEANRSDDVDYRIVAGRGQALAEVRLPRELLSSDGSFDAERLVTGYKVERAKRSVVLVALKRGKSERPRSEKTATRKAAEPVGGKRKEAEPLGGRRKAAEPVGGKRKGARPGAAKSSKAGKR